jgi:drug/metabolite transporter (DMT)-like permease
MAGVFLLHEHVPLRGWIGTVIIMAGATLTGLTEHEDKPHATPTHFGEDRPQ